MDVLNIQDKIRGGEKLAKKEADYYRERMLKINEKCKTGNLTKKEEVALEEYENMHDTYEFNVTIEAERAITPHERYEILSTITKALTEIGYPEEDLDIG